MKSILERYKFDGVWHFTGRSNIGSIKKHNGLLSVARVEEKGANVLKSGGNQWSHDADKLKGVHNYVHLAFLDDHPMLFVAKNDGRITDPIWLKIDSSVLLEPDVRFTCDVSNKSGVDILTPDQAVGVIGFEVAKVFGRAPWH